ncbi:tRNA (guanine-N2-)-methyltransferase catalytic subunit Trm11 [Schizosaccharomyces pombe]|uniref:tRNA (guanine(10)-N(2))-methyltransferase n=1 Tax=Schizosaccharomyces pombe (strain 972 / ATCC 24843) TaxID=284812 RepID=TRM11_SCHPO|nr:tRNA (guanine-N2-)-methyltransferase catalytic subunit Trm11 [Schizosaccharomyces pombe]O94636.2 RecName: Full=tRNA (guanine(10)-N2)-methyltransferase; AltName: Full=tRNA guanosine-2'-O-methyltransferase TRM11; Short=tRNA methylase 11 [Schizosaccharomyces pombe 972h-]CAB38506.2 tRNA (guanine-N2-)-methyltransferase catalytic subunit Trm11 (predicted) [Schizosaccharomyces pombe]|eukprot:NP_596497.2 tRNA (guanine-N2-)-methyltransferase catalytic subunit Trm11 [Schizosaccharomyces pombe]
MSVYLLHLASTHAHFHLPELETLAKIENVEFWLIPKSEYLNVAFKSDKSRNQALFSHAIKEFQDSISPNDATTQNPFMLAVVNSNEDARRWIRRSIFCKGIYEIYCIGDSFTRLHEKMKELNPAPWDSFKHNSSYKFTFETFGTRRTMKEQLSIISDFEYMQLQGPVSMHNPQHVFTVLENRRNNVEGPKVYFGHWCGSGSRDAIDTFDLKQRSYIGITSFDAELSLVTAQMAMAAPGKLIYDPFVGTGSFLYTCSFFGAHTLGSDIDGRQMRGKNGRSIKSNFRQYKLSPFFLDTFTGDVTNCPLRKNLLLDAIVCDPPYGVRAGAKKIAKCSQRPPKESSSTGNHYPKLEQYQISDMVYDIICFASDRLVDGGRLVLWLPTITEEYGIDDIPSHPYLSLIYNSIQPFTHWSRRLLTFQRLPRAHDSKSLNLLPKINNKTPSHHNFREKYFSSAGRASASTKFSPVLE